MNNNVLTLPVVVERELEIEIVKDQWVCYYGTSAQLKDEGFGPELSEWPSGRSSLCWCEGELEFWLRRCRPQGMKGPAKLWTEGDFWFLRISRFDEGGSDHRVRYHQRALKEAAYQASEQGRRQCMETIDRLLEARADQHFQAFKAKFPALNSPKRLRTGKKPRMPPEASNE